MGAPKGIGSGPGVTPPPCRCTVLLPPPRPVLPAQPLPSHSQDNDAPAPGSCHKKSHICTAAPSPKSRSKSKFRVQAGESPRCPSRPCWGLQIHCDPMTAWDRFGVPTSTIAHPDGCVLGGFTRREPHATRGTGPREHRELHHRAAHPDTGSQLMLWVGIGWFFGENATAGCSRARRTPSGGGGSQDRISLFPVSTEIKEPASIPQ